MFGGRENRKNNNTRLDAKMGLRRRIAAEMNLDAPRVLVMYPGDGVMDEAWPPGARIERSEGDALAFADAADSFEADIYDIDPWGSPWAAIRRIAAKHRGGDFAIVATDGSVLKMKMNGWLSPELRDLAGVFAFRGAARRHNMIALTRQGLSGAARLQGEVELRRLLFVGHRQGSNVAYFGAVFRKLAP